MSELIKVKRFAKVQRFSEPRSRFHFGSLDARTPLHSQQLTANHIQIRQGTGHERPIGILHETSVAHLGETKDALDDGGVHNRALRNLEAALLQVSPDLFEHPLAQLVLLQQVAKLADGGFVGHRLTPQINARKLAHRHRFVQRLFHRRIREIEPVLQAVDSNHPLKLDGQAPIARLRIHRKHQGAKFVLRNHAIHLRQKLGSPCRLRVAFESRSGQCHLLHRVVPLESSRMASTTYKTLDQMTYSELP